MKTFRLVSVLCAAALLLAGCKKTPPPPLSPAAVASRWWQAVVSGDDRGVASYFSEDSARSKSGRVIAEYAQVEKAAGEGDRLAAEMLERLKGVKVGAVQSGPMMAVVPLVLEDDRPFLEVRLELRENRWVIIDISDGVRR